MVQRGSHPVLGCVPHELLHRQGHAIVAAELVQMTAAMSLIPVSRQELVLEHVRLVVNSECGA